MPIETFNFVTDLVTTNPIETDNVSEGDDHLRGLKTTLKNTFPNLNAAVTATPAQLNRVITAMPDGRTITAAASGGQGGQVVISGTVASEAMVFLNTGTILNSHTLGLYALNGTTAAFEGSFADGVWHPSVAVDAPSVKQGGSVLIPSGVVVMWNGSATAIPAGWLLCDGSNGTPNLVNKFILGGQSAGAGGPTPGTTGGQFSASFTSSSAGSHYHASATGLAGGGTFAAVTDSQGAHAHSFGTGGHALTYDEMPAHVHTYTRTSGAGTSFAASGSNGPAEGTVNTSSAGNGQAHNHSISIDGAHQHNVSTAVPDHQHAISLDGAHTHATTVSTIPPYYVLCYIMKS